MEKERELFVKAFLDAEALDNSKLIKEEDIEWDFSEQFEKLMSKLIQKNNHISYSTRRHIRKGLIAAIVAIIVLFTGLLSVSATRTPIVEFVKRIFPQFNEITLSEDSVPKVDSIETEFTLDYLPEGYYLDTYQSDDLGVYTVWKNNSGDEIIFSQEILNSNVSIDTEHNYTETYVNEYKAYLTTYEYNSVLNWSDNRYWFILNVPKELEQDIIFMAENISEKK